MIEFVHISLKDFIKKHNPQEPKKETIENFEKEINSLLENAKGQDGEEFQKNEINSFLKNTYGYKCNIYEKVDSAIYVDGKAWVLIEVKALNNRNEFPKDRENPISKAFCQMVFYFLDAIENNNSLKHAIICNAHEFFLFDCKDLLNLFQNDKEITKLHKNCASNEGTDPSTKRFYSDLEEYLKKDFKGELPYTHFNLSSYDPKEELPLIYQVLSHEVLLKQRKTLDANTLNKDFYEELLYILGLEEQNDKGKILIKPSRTENSLSDALKKAYKNLDDEEVMALLIAWNNRILFLRLLESLLISFKHFEKPFLTIENFTNFNALNTTFSLELKDPKTKAELEKAIEKHIKKYNFFALDDKSLLDGLNYFIPNLFGTLKLSPKEEEEAFASYGRIRALRKKLDDALSGREYQNAFEWRFEFPEVLNDEGDFLGFDCIIGNPPYIDYRKIDEKTKIFLSKFSSVYKKSKEGSIFVYFIELASQLIIKHGEISFINPIAYLCKPTDHGIRDYIDKNLKITMLIDLSNIKIFESASTYTCINIFKRENKKNEILFQRSDDFAELSSNKDDFLKIPSVNIEHISIFLDPISRHIAERCKTQLGDFCKIFCGLSKMGFRSDVINTNNKKSVYFLESSDIYRYYVNDFGKKFLKRIDDYFSQEKRWIFESQDIIFMTRMTNQIRCVVVPLGVYGGKVNILHDFRIDRFLILGILNSKLMTYFYKKKFFPTHMQGGAFGFDTLSVETLPIPQITKSNQPTADKITDGAKQILTLKEKDPKANTQKLEKEIDALVYQLYNLTDEEIKIIEEGQEIKS
ncbi:hypothetical protein JP0021_04690 [Helicobacter pylori]